MPRSEDYMGAASFLRQAAYPNLLQSLVILLETGSADSDTLEQSIGVTRGALARYLIDGVKFGFFCREKVGGRYHYSLTEHGSVLAGLVAGLVERPVRAD